MIKLPPKPAPEVTIEPGSIIQVGRKTVVVTRAERIRDGDEGWVDELSGILVSVNEDDESFPLPENGHLYNKEFDFFISDLSSMRGKGLEVRSQDITVIGCCSIKRKITIDYEISKVHPV